MTSIRRDAASPARAGGVAHERSTTVQHDVLTEEQRRHLLGDDDTPGVLDEYKVITYMPHGDKPVIAWFCPRQHGDSTGHVGLIVRDLDGDQSGLTLGELVTAAIDHEIEAH